MGWRGGQRRRRRANLEDLLFGRRFTRASGFEPESSGFNGRRHDQLRHAAPVWSSFVRCCAGVGGHPEERLRRPTAPGSAPNAAAGPTQAPAPAIEPDLPHRRSARCPFELLGEAWFWVWRPNNPGTTQEQQKFEVLVSENRSCCNIRLTTQILNATYVGDRRFGAVVNKALRNQKGPGSKPRTEQCLSRLSLLLLMLI